MKFKLPEKIEGPQNWYGQEIKSSKEWIYTLTTQDIKEIEGALKLDKNTDVAAIKRNNFPLAWMLNREKAVVFPFVILIRTPFTRL